jgi:predicted extracellular nuclease
MNRTFSTRMMLPAFSLMAAACLSPKTNTDDSDTGASGFTPGDAGEVSIFDLQTGEVEAGSTVTLVDVVVTSGLTAEGAGFYVQDEGGGEYSGLYVYIYDEVELVPVVGDTVTLSGEFGEFYDATQITVAGAADAYITGTSAPVATLLEIEPTDWEVWESCLVTLEDQTVTSAVNSYGEVDLSIGIPMDNTFVNFSASVGDVIGSVTGPIAYSFETFKINPRSQDDLVGAEVGGGGETTVASIQTGDVGDGAYVTLTDVIATSGLTQSEGGFFVQDAGGGAYSGIFIYVYEDVAVDLGSIEAGQKMTVIGQVSEFYDYTQVTVGSSADIEVTGSGDVTIDVATADGGDWEAWEGCLITVADVTVTSDVDGYGAMDLDNGLKIDDDLADYTAANGETFGTLTGLLSYGFDYFRINPRSQTDLSSDGTVPDPDPEPVSEATVADIQSGVVAEGSTVTISAVVTSEDNLDERGFFVQDAGGGEYSGVYVYRGASSAVSIGDIVEITGVVTEYYELTELVVSADEDIVVTEPGAGSVVIDAVSDVSDWEIWEGCIVTVSDVTVTSDDDGYGAHTMDNGLMIDDMLFSHGASDGDVFSELTGLISYGYEAWRINPRDGDL